jgi:hypothetical protein
MSLEAASQPLLRCDRIAKCRNIWNSAAIRV